MKIIFIFSILIHFFPSLCQKNFSAIKKEKNNEEKHILERNDFKLLDFNSLYDKFFYSKTEILKVAVKNLHSLKHQIPYDYQYLDLCNTISITRPKEGISELLTGKRMRYTNYYVFMNQNETCVSACTKNFTGRHLNRYRWLINRNYRVTYYLDKLPSGFKTFYTTENNKKIDYINYFSGIPIGYKARNEYYIYNHLVFYIEINKKNDKYQVVNFYISAHSVKQSDEKICSNYEESKEKMVADLIKKNKNGTTINKTNIPPLNEKLTNMKKNEEKLKTIENLYKDRTFNILEDDVKRYYKVAKKQKLEIGNIAFTYDVIFINSNVSFSSRYDHYFSFEGNYRWFGLILSNFLIFVLSLGIFLILARTVNKDLNKFNVVNDFIIDENSWKQINGDVFRPPKHPKTLSAFIGTGVEVLCIIIASLILNLIGFIKPEIRSKMINYLFLCCILFSVISGYVSTFVYRNLGGKDWLKNCIVTAFFFPIISLVVLGIIRILMSFEQSSASFKISQMAILCFLWLFVSSPLVLVGTFLSLFRRTINYPCKVNAIPTTIDPKPWYLHLQYFVWFIGIVPFATFAIEFIYLMKSIWIYQVYYIASFLSLSLIFGIIISSEMSIIYVFINLCYGDHKWWWKSFFVSSSPALYVLMYSLTYFLHLEITRLSAIVVYFLINALIFIIVALVLGSCGTLLTFWFVFYIYSKIKID